MQAEGSESGHSFTMSEECAIHNGTHYVTWSLQRIAAMLLVDEDTVEERMRHILENGHFCGKRLCWAVGDKETAKEKAKAVRPGMGHADIEDIDELA